MFNNNLVLKAAEHTNLRAGNTTDWFFAAAELVVPVVYSEMADAAREYPLIFLKDKPLLYVLTGIEQGVNAYVADDGRWLANYIPARLRNYPFALTPIPNQSGEFAIMVDASAPQLMQQSGQLLFENGVPSVYLKQRMAQLKAMQQAESATVAMVKAIRDAGLLIEQAIRIKRHGQEDGQVVGLEVVDEKKLNRLSHEEFAKLRDRGVLPLIYAHLLSMANLRQGVLAGKYPQLGQQASSDTTGTDDFFATDTIKFN